MAEHVTPREIIDRCAMLAVVWAATACAPPEPEAISFTRLTDTALEADTSSSPSASWADIDDDGDDDLYVLNGFATLAENQAPQPDLVYRNDSGVLTPIPDHPLVDDPAFSGSAIWGDYDNDGDADVFVANQQQVDNFLYRNDGDGTFLRVVDGPVVSDGGRSFTAAWVDIDTDGDLDLHVANGWSGAGGEPDFFYRNRGDGTFERVVGLPMTTDTLPSAGPAWGDYDDDGDPDLYQPYRSSDANRLYRNDGGWAFTEVTEVAGLRAHPFPVSPPVSAARWVDYDNDGDLDLFVGNTGGRLDFLYRNDGSRFVRVTAGRLGLDATYVSDATWADLDNDGDRDLVLAVWGGASEVYRNDGEAGFRPVDAGDFGAVVNFASSVSPADFDADGDLDLFLTQWPVNDAGGLPNQLYRNESAAGSWLDIRLEGTTSNRSAIGATIFVTAEIDGRAVRQRRDVTSRTSWRSAGSLTRHFGLGDATEVDRVDVIWPSGAVDTVEGPIDVNQRLRIVERRGRTD